MALASLACVFFLINGGIAYMTSSGRPDKLEHAKKVIRNALLGLVLVIAAGTMTAILAHAYQGSGGNGVDKLPALGFYSAGPGIRWFSRYSHQSHSRTSAKHYPNGGGSLFERS